jgi:uncharacterized protein
MGQLAELGQLGELEQLEQLGQLGQLVQSVTSISTVSWRPHPKGARPAALAKRFDAADFSPRLRTRLLILQATPFCNIDCSYCYLPSRSDRSRMEPATVRRAAQRLREDGLLGDQLTVVWHAGEPLTAPPAFYEQAFELLQAELGSAVSLSFALQTNAILIDDAWCRLFERQRMRVGVSLDGPAAWHDAHRRTRQGKGTHAQAMQGLQRLQAAGIECHAIAVVTAQALAEPDAFFDFFLQAGLHEVGCSFDEAEGAHVQSSLAGQEAAHAAFLQRLLARSLAHGGGLQVRELAAAWRSIAAERAQTQWRGETFPDNAQVQPFSLVSVGWNGDFGSFSPELLGQPAPAWGNFVLGNVHQQGFFESAESPRFRRLWAEILAGVEVCRQRCTHFDWCGGGAPVNKFYENGRFDSGATLYCRSMVQRPFDAVLQQLESDASLAQGVA